jgi:hypothetical protein
VAWVGKCVFQLDQQCLQAHPQLQRRLAVAAGVEVGAGAEEEGLAGIRRFATAEHRRDPFLGPQLFFAAAPAGGAGAGIDLAGLAEFAGSSLLTAAVADQDALSPLGGKLAAGMRIGAGERLRVEGAVQQFDPFFDEDVDRVLGLAGFIEPA